MSLIPDSHKDLLEKTIPVAMATIMPDGKPQSSVVWFKWDGEKVMISTIKGRRKTKNIEERPSVSLLFVDPDNMYRTLEIRGTVEITEAGAFEFIDELAQMYMGQNWYGGAVAAEVRDQQERVILNIVPERVTTH